MRLFEVRRFVSHFVLYNFIILLLLIGIPYIKVNILILLLTIILIDSIYFIMVYGKIGLYIVLTYNLLSLISIITFHDLNPIYFKTIITFQMILIAALLYLYMYIDMKDEREKQN